MDIHSTIRALLVAIALLLGTVAGLAGGILAKAGGASNTAAIRQGAIAFASAVSLTLAVMAALMM